MRVEFTLPLPPSVNRLWRSNRGRVHPSAEYKAWLREAHGEWLQQRPKLYKIPGEFTLSLVAQKPDNRRRDLDNLLKAIMDFCSKMDIIQDDNLCQELHAKWSDVRDNACMITVQALE